MNNLCSSVFIRGSFKENMEAAVAAQPNYPYFTEEHRMFRETVKQFVQKEIAPFAEEWDEAGIFPR